MIDFDKKVWICNECKAEITMYSKNQPYCHHCGSKDLDEKPKYIKKG